MGFCDTVLGDFAAVLNMAKDALGGIIADQEKKEAIDFEALEENIKTKLAPEVAKVSTDTKEDDDQER